MKEIKITIEIKGEDKSNSEEELKNFLGEEFIGYKGREAIDKLMEEKRGYIKDAFFRKEIGNIALVWGDEKYGGLCHILKRRLETKQPIKKLLDSIKDIIEHGELEFNEKKNRFNIKYKHKIAVVNLDYYNKSFIFLLTAFYEYGQY